MSRTRAASLVLVNWRGVFYERYALDQHVTALEGANGAGKTTVMIAAYLVLLPDLGRLKFTNLGESGATGGDRGIEGRLGRNGSPSYAAMEFLVPRHGRLLAAVQLVPGRDGRIELKTMLVTDLNSEVRLQQLLLHRVGEEDRVPELSELRDAVGRAGARMTVFPSAKDYFQALFDHGVTPLRLVAEEEKSKLNEMLRTSMTGGISRSLTNDLRSFLLRPETTLGDTLTTMRSNLEACRRTRDEVGTSRVLQAEISGVYEAGEEMFAAALHATRERASESRRTADKARDLHDDGRRAKEHADLALDRAQRAMETVGERLEEARGRAAATEESHRSHLRARALVVRLELLDAEVVSAEARAAALEEKSAGAARALAEARRAASRSDEAWRLAAGGLARMQEGVGELYRRAEAHRQVTGQLTTARKVVPSWLDEVGVDGALERVTTERVALDAEAASVDGRVRTAEHRRVEHAKVMAALERVAGGPVDPLVAHERAGRELARLAELRSLAEREGAIGVALAQARSRTTAQARVRDAAKALGLAAGSLPGARLVGQAHDAAQAEREDADRAREEAERLAASARRDQDEARRHVAALEQRSASWRDVSTILSRLGDGVADGVALEALERSLRAARDRLLAAVAGAVERRDTSQRQAHELESAGGTFSPDLLRLVSDVGGELLASRFDDLDPEDAGPYQAMLGPLAEAIVVDDVPDAAARIAQAPRAIDTVWVVDGAHGIDTTAADGRRGQDVVVVEASGTRITRVPERPTLGRRAREARVLELRTTSEQCEVERLAFAAQLTAVEARIDLASQLRSLLPVLEAGDPRAELDAAQARAAAAAKAEGEHRSVAARAREAAGVARVRVDAVLRILPDAHLLDAPDWAAEALRLAGEHAAATEAKDQVARTRVDAERLAERVDELRVPPPTEAEVGDLRARLGQIEARRAALFLADGALVFIREHREALDWSDAAERLVHERALVPELEAAEAAARKRAEEDAARVTEADEHTQAAVREAQEAHGVLVRAAASRDAVRDELQAVGVGTPSEADVISAREAMDLAREAFRTAEAERDGVAAEHARRSNEAQRAAETARDLSERLAAAESEARPHEDRWGRLEQLASGKGVLGPAQSARFVTAFTGLGSPNLSTRARTAGARLVERLRTATRAADVLAAVQQWVGSDEDRSGEGYLDVWVQVLDWLRRRLPAHIAEVDDPLLALTRLHAELTGLEERLRGQETQLRGHSADVASHIEVQIRKAVGQVQQLNRHLDGVAFGSVGSIRVRSRHLESMGRILRALREEGEVQALLFDPGLPFEEALDQLFRRYGGGGSGGQRLLDYREYIELHVEVKRRASVEWEAASATKLSTGEAIGVGAAVMMVVLAEWERDANLLRGKKSHGSLRFLFLDEANRLDRGNLDEVFELCRTLELQLLVAAPEVARAAGITTYRLERVVDGEGERVLVSGRRTRAAP